MKILRNPLCRALFFLAMGVAVVLCVIPREEVGPYPPGDSIEITRKPSATAPWAGDSAAGLVLGLPTGTLASSPESETRLAPTVDPDGVPVIAGRPSRADAPEGMGLIELLVRQDGAAVPGATVKIRGDTPWAPAGAAGTESGSTTNKDGRAWFYVGGLQMVEVEVFTTDAAWTERAHVMAPMPMFRRTAVIRLSATPDLRPRVFRVISASTGDPLANAQLRCRIGDGSQVFDPMLTDSRGFAAARVPVGSTLDVTAPAYLPRSIEVRASNAHGALRNLALDPCCAIKVVGMVPDGRAGQVRFELVPDGHPDQVLHRVDARFEDPFLMDGIDAGESLHGQVRLQVRTWRSSRAIGPALTLSPGEVTVLDVGSEPVEDLLVTAIYGDGSPMGTPSAVGQGFRSVTGDRGPWKSRVDEVSLHLTSESAGLFDAVTQVPSGGTVRLADVPLGSYSYSIHSAEGDVVGSGTLTHDGHSSPNLMLNRCGRIRCVVTDATPGIRKLLHVTDATGSVLAVKAVEEGDLAVHLLSIDTPYFLEVRPLTHIYRIPVGPNGKFADPSPKPPPPVLWRGTAWAGGADVAIDLR